MKDALELNQHAENQHEWLLFDALYNHKTTMYRNGKHKRL